MATSPAVLNPTDLRRAASKSWLPAFCCLLFISFTSSTLMSGYHTQFVVNDAWKLVFGNWHYSDWPGILNHDGRKIGHFFGYGAVGLIFRQAWYQTLRVRRLRLGRVLNSNRLFLLSAVLSVLSIFLVSSLDELHQCFVPQRVGSFSDVVRDTFGTVFLNLVLLAWRAWKRPPAGFEWNSSASPNSTPEQVF
jgi:VanZ family protein